MSFVGKGALSAEKKKPGIPALQGGGANDTPERKGVSEKKKSIRRRKGPCSVDV